MRRTIILLALSFLMVGLVVSCGGAVSSSDTINSQTPTRPPTTTASVSTSPVPNVSASPAAANVRSPSAAPCTEEKKPVITKPVEGGKVILVDTVSGTTPCPEMNHYVLVIPSDNAVKWVQDKPFNYGKGTFNSEAQFGEGDNGIGKKFLVRILVTKEKLPAGQMNQTPADGIMSEAITVSREK